MRTFDQLTQDEQMHAVEKLRDKIIEDTVSEHIPECFQAFTKEIQTIFDDFNANYNQVPWYFVKDYLIERIEDNRPMKLAMLHYAGKLAKQAFYPEANDVIV